MLASNCQDTHSEKWGYQIAWRGGPCPPRPKPFLNFQAGTFCNHLNLRLKRQKEVWDSSTHPWGCGAAGRRDRRAVAEGCEKIW